MRCGRGPRTGRSPVGCRVVEETGRRALVVAFVCRRELGERHRPDRVPFPRIREHGKDIAGVADDGPVGEFTVNPARSQALRASAREARRLLGEALASSSGWPPEGMRHGAGQDRLDGLVRLAVAHVGRLARAFTMLATSAVRHVGSLRVIRPFLVVLGEAACAACRTSGCTFPPPRCPPAERPSLAHALRPRCDRAIRALRTFWKYGGN